MEGNLYKAAHMTRWLACGTLAVALAFILVGCNGDSLAPSPTPTEAELTEPTPTVEPTPTPTVEPTPTPTLEPTPTPQPKLEPIDLNPSILDQFPAIERSCLLFDMEEDRLDRLFKRETSATAEEIEAIAGCISRDTVIALYLGGIANESGSLSGETSACAVGRLKKMDKDALAVALFDRQRDLRQRDLRSDDQVVLGYDREAIEDLEASIWHSIFLCLNKEEWTALSPSVDLNVDDVGIDALRCVLNELGPLGFVELFDAAEGATPSVEVFSAAENCEIDLESLLSRQTRLEPAPTATPQAQREPTAVPAATPAPAATQAPFEKAPDFELPFYRNRAGEPGLRLSDLSGTPVVLNFWFAGCPPCRPTMSAIETVYMSGRWAEVLFLGIQIPLGTEQLDPDRGQAFAEEIGVSYALVFDAEEEVSRNYGIAGFPTTIVLDSYHNIVGRWAGVLDGNVLENLIRQIASPSVAPRPTSTSTDPPEVVSPTISAPPTSDPIVTKGSKLGELLSLIPNDDWFKQYILFNEYQNRPVGGEQRAEVSGGRTAFADGTFGYSADQVHRDLDVGNKPRSIQIVEGKIDEGVIEEAFLNLGFEFTVVPGGEILFQGEDFEFSSGTGVLTFQNRVIIQEDRLIYPRVMDDGKSIVHPTRDESLLSDPDISALVESLSRHVVWSAFLGNRSLSANSAVQHYSGLDETEAIPPEYSEAVRRLETSIVSAPLLHPYGAWAAALVTDEHDLPNTLLAIVYSDQATAVANSSVLEQRLQETEVVAYGQPWTDFFDYFEIKVNGRVLEVELFGTDSDFPIEMANRREFVANLLVSSN